MLILPKTFNAELTLFGGQSFVWRDCEYGYLGLHSNLALLIKKTKNGFYAEQLCGEELDLENYFSKPEFERFLRSDTFKAGSEFKRARELLGDIFVLKQDFADTFFSFLLSSNNNISRIRSSVACLSLKLGRKIKLGGENYYMFPSAEQMAQEELSLFYECGAGYRAEYLKESAQKFLREKDGMKEMKGIKLIEKLKEFKGVGDKVADCIAVFSGKADEYSPIDRWAKRAILNTYGKEFAKYYEYRKFLSKKFGKHAKFAGQYLFESERLKGQVDTLLSAASR